MAMKDKRIDAYISKSADFAKPVLAHLRKLVHQACPEVQERVKWGMPSFEYKGILCGMAAFKNHCAFGFWKSKLLKDHHNILESTEKTAMGNLGRITGMKDLPSDKVIVSFIQEAARLNEEGVKLPPRPKVARKALKVPGYFMNALRKNKKALAVFGGFSYSHQKEYVEWVTEAKTEETRNKRLSTTVQWLSEGKARNWKYLRK